MLLVKASVSSSEISSFQGTDCKVYVNAQWCLTHFEYKQKDPVINHLTTNFTDFN